MQNSNENKMFSLAATTGTNIEIDISNPDWCRCWLRQAENITYLGAEGLAYIKRHLTIGLSDRPKEISGKLDGHDVFWILSLAESHHVLYAAVNEESGILFWENVNAVVIGVMKLSPHEKSHWIGQLESL